MEHMFRIGPCAITSCSIKDFTKANLDFEQMQSLWKLCGPSVERNMEHHPLWKVIVMAYYEGLAHGVAGLESLQEKEQSNLKARTDNLIIIGLSEENVKRLMEGQPMMFNMGDFNLPELQGITAVIMYGKTEIDIQNEILSLMKEK